MRSREELKQKILEEQRDRYWNVSYDGVTEAEFDEEDFVVELGDHFLTDNSGVVADDYFFQLSDEDKLLELESIGMKLYRDRIPGFNIILMSYLKNYDNSFYEKYRFLLEK